MTNDYRHLASVIKDTSCDLTLVVLLEGVFGYTALRHYKAVSAYIICKMSRYCLLALYGGIRNIDIILSCADKIGAKYKKM